MKKIIITMLLLVSAAVFAQNTDKDANYLSQQDILNRVFQTTSEILRVDVAGGSSSRSFVSKDTVLTVGTTAYKLSDSLGTFDIYYLEIINMAGSGTIYYGLTTGVLTQGFPLLYFQSYSDELGFFKSTANIYFIASTTGCQIRIRYKKGA